MDGLSGDLQDRLDDYNANFEALNKALAETDSLDQNATAELQVEQTKNMLTAALPIAVKSVILLASSAVSETTKLRASQYLIDRALGKEGDLANEDEATKLLKRLIVSGSIEKGGN